MKHILAINSWHHDMYAGLEGVELWQPDGFTTWQGVFHPENDGKWMPGVVGVKLYSQCSLSDPVSERHMYAFKTTMRDEISMHKIEDARAMVRRLAQIGCKYEALCKQLGYPESFAQYAGYLANCIGADLAVYRDTAMDYVFAVVEDVRLLERKQLGKEQ